MIRRLFGGKPNCSEPSNRLQGLGCFTGGGKEVSLAADIPRLLGLLGQRRDFAGQRSLGFTEVPGGTLRAVGSIAAVLLATGRRIDAGGPAVGSRCRTVLGGFVGRRRLVLRFCRGLVGVGSLGRRRVSRLAGLLRGLLAVRGRGLVGLALVFARCRADELAVLVDDLLTGRTELVAFVAEDG